jgi:hypothetical protein
MRLWEDNMGDFTVSCSASGLPIPHGSEAVVLFVTPKHGMESGGCYVYDMFQYISWPMFITMDDYGGFYEYFGEEHFCKKPKLGGKFAELTAQTAWQVFWPHVQTSRKLDSGKLHEHSDWARNIIYKDSGYWHYPFVWGRKPEFDDGLIQIAFTYYRRDVWDYLVKKNQKNFRRGDNEFETEVRRLCEPIPKGLSPEDRADIAKDQSFPWGDFLHHDLQRLLKYGHQGERFDKEVIYNTELTPKQLEELIKLTVDMYFFTNELGDTLCRPILPATTSAPQAGWHEPWFRESQQKFHEFCLKAMKSDWKAIEE